MPHFLCLTCGAQFAETVHPPARCPICQDERQYVGPEGQRWTTLEQLAQGHRNAFRQLEPGLHERATQPKFAIGQRALLSGGEALPGCVGAGARRARTPSSAPSGFVSQALKRKVGFEADLSLGERVPN